MKFFIHPSVIEDLIEDVLLFSLIMASANTLYGVAIIKAGGGD